MNTDKLIDMFCEWPLWAQIVFPALLAGGVVTLIGHLADQLRIVVRGYPPQEFEYESDDEEESKRMTCDNDDNLTGVCIKPVHDCRTQGECDNAVDACNHAPSRRVHPEETPKGSVPS